MQTVPQLHCSILFGVIQVQYKDEDIMREKLIIEIFLYKESVNQFVWFFDTNIVNSDKLIENKIRLDATIACLNLHSSPQILPTYKYLNFTLTLTMEATKHLLKMRKQLNAFLLSPSLRELSSAINVCPKYTVFCENQRCKSMYVPCSFEKEES